MLELKLINEIKQSAETKHGTTTKKTVTSSTPSALLDPASQLLSELCASFNMDTGQRHAQNEYAVSTLKTNETNQDQQHHPYKDSSISSSTTESILSGGNVGFKLKRVDKRNNPQKEETSDGQIIDFKARLRKVENAEKERSLEEKSTITEQSSESEEQQDDKRRSTGSISSLKKLWENKESCDSQPHSPKLSVRGNSGKQETLDQTEDSPEDHSGASTRSQSSGSKSDTRLWPPTEPEKPVVPAKPLKPLSSSTKHFGSSIYATPNCTKSQHAEDDLSKQNTDSRTAKQIVLELSTLIENSVLNLKSSSTIVMTSWLQLSDKVGLLHGMCANLADSGIAPHARFQFRELLARLELQARQLRAAGTRNVTENTRLLTDLQNTIKDVVNTVQR